MRTVGHLNNAALAVVALLISVHAAFSAASVGDYRGDASPALTALLHGDLDAFGRAHPAMGDLSLLVRAPFAGIAHIWRPTEVTVYRWGVLPCVISLAVLGLWLARIARTRGTGAVGQWAIVLLSVLNPLVTSAIALGHPEELMTASLCVAALVAALERRALLSTVLLGLAIACKQWSVVAILPVLLALERDRVRALGGALAVAAVVTIPEVVGAPASYLHNQLALSHDSSSGSTQWTWWWALTPNVTKHVTVEGTTVPFTFHTLPLAVERALRPLVIVVDILVAAIVARVRGLPLRRDDAFALMALVLLLRCTLSTETAEYYHAGLFLTLLAWDAVAGERIPIRALAATVVAYVLFDRLSSSVIGVAPSSLLYDACTGIVFLLLVQTLARPHSTASQRRSQTLATSTQV